MGYDFTAIENKWQKYWDEHKTFHAENDYSKPKFYALVEFPYPSGQGLHIGHPRPYTAMDIVSRKRRLQGYNVLFPMGWDAFGLPTENFAIKNKIHPAIVTKNNVARFKAQLKSLGLSFDWDREINTTDPDYFKWTQWIFLKLFKAGLAYKKEMNVNWCTSCKVVLANEEVVNGKCERCGGEVVHKVKSQWMLKITEYAQKLIDDLDSVDYFEKIKTAQKNWIGRSTGAEVDFTTTAGDMLTIYTTRPDTLFGATYMVISPEHPVIAEIKDSIKNGYISKAVKQFNLKCSLEEYFSGGEPMSTDYESIRKELRRKIQSKETEQITSDEEYYYAVGQLVNYFISLSKAKDKKHSLANPFFNIKNNQALKDKLRQYFIKYNYQLKCSGTWFNNLYAMICNYTKAEKTDQNSMIAGYINNNILYQKKNMEEQVNE